MLIVPQLPLHGGGRIWYAFGRDPSGIVGLDEYLRGGVGSDSVNDFLVGVLPAVVVENDEIGIETVHVVGQSLNQEFAAVAADRAILSGDFGLWKAHAQVLRNGLWPFLFCDRLAVNENSDGIAMDRGAGREERHGALNAGAGGYGPADHEVTRSLLNMRAGARRR